ncbi:MAG: hypothetical protein IIT82_02225, partial [Selenomonas sp.]|nr:hypothetical protein [Selenomonas sp.]
MDSLAGRSPSEFTEWEAALALGLLSVLTNICQGVVFFAPFPKIPAQYAVLEFVASIRLLSKSYADARTSQFEFKPI